MSTTHLIWNRRRVSALLTVIVVVSLPRDSTLPLMAQQPPDSSDVRPELALQFGHRQAVTSMAFSPDGKTLATGSADHTVKLWNTQTWTMQRTLSGHRSLVSSVAFSPDGRTLASASYDDTVKLWDAQTGELKRTLTRDRISAWSVVFSPDGKTVVSGGFGVRFWDAQTGELLRTLDEAVAPVSSSPDGKSVSKNSVTG